MGFWKKAACVGIAAAAVGGAGAYSLENGFAPRENVELPTELSLPEELVETTGSLICDRTVTLEECNADNTLAPLIYKGNNIRLNYEDLDQFFKDALVATEDKEFWNDTDGKVSNEKLAACFARNRGCSTLTWQLVRNLFPDDVPSSEETCTLRVSNIEAIDRIASDAAELVSGGKIKMPADKCFELDMGNKLKEQFTDEELITTYANIVYFGSGGYGVEMTSRMMFGKSFKDTNHLQKAYLAGMPQSPNNRDGDVDPHKSVEERDRGELRMVEVLNNMIENGSYTKEQLEELIKDEQLDFVEYQVPQQGFSIDYNKANLLGYRHYLDDVLVQLRNTPELMNDQGVVTDQKLASGLKIKVGLDINVQTAIATSVAENPLELDGRQYAIEILAEDGAIIGHYGGDYNYSQFDMLDAVGSNGSEGTKPWAFVKAYNDGLIDENSELSSDPNFTWEAWQNADGSQGWTPLDPGNRCATILNLATCTPNDAIRVSDNVAILQLAENGGLEGLASLEQLMRDYGLNSPNSMTPSGLIGSYDTSPHQRALGLNSLINNEGIRVGSYIIDTIHSTRDGSLIYQNQPDTQPSLVGIEAINKLIEGLRLVPRSGTADAHLADFPSDIIGKTGTDGNPNYNEAASFISVACLDKAGGDVTMIIALRHVDTPSNLGPGQTGGNIPGKLTNEIGRKLIGDSCTINT